MVYGFLILISLAILAVLVLRREPEGFVGRSGLSRLALLTGLGVLGVYSFFLLLMGIGELSAGDRNGLTHLLVAFVVTCMAYLAYRCPCESGVVFMLLGILSGFVLLQITIAQPVSTQVTSFFVGSAPFLIAGFFIIISGWLSRLNINMHR